MVTTAAELRNWKTRMAVGRMAYESGHFSQASRHFYLALKIVEDKELGDEFGYQTLISLAKALACQGKFADAEKYLLEVERTQPEDAVERAWDLEELSQLYWQTGRTEQSEEVANKALALLEQSDEQPAELKAKILRNLARAKGNAGDVKECSRLIESALLVIEDSDLGKQSLIYGEVLVIKALLLAEEDKLEAASQVYHQALQLVQMNRGPFHPRIAEIMDFFGEYAEHKGKDDLAKEFRRRGTEIRQFRRRSGLY